MAGGPPGWGHALDRSAATQVKLIPKPVERVFYAVITPLVNGLIRAGVRPNMITVVGTGLVLVSAWAYAVGQVRWGGGLLLLSGIVDTLDGAVARGNRMVTKFGAFFDSTLDRVGDGATFLGIAVYLLTAPESAVAYRIPAAVVCMVGIIASLIVSYARARAEGLGIDCKVGIVQRAERIVGLGVPSVLVGAGSEALVLEAIVLFLTLASVITVVQRFVYVYQVTKSAPAAAPESPAKGL